MLRASQDKVGSNQRMGEHPKQSTTKQVGSKDRKNLCRIQRPQARGVQPGSSAEELDALLPGREGDSGRVC